MPNSRSRTQALTSVLAGVTMAAVWVMPAASHAQDFLPPQTQAVEFRGTIRDINERTQTISIATETGIVFAQVNPVRRALNGQIIASIPPVRVQVLGWDTPDMLRRGQFVQLHAKLEDRRRTVDPVKEITLVAGIPNPGFLSPPPEEVDGLGELGNLEFDNDGERDEGGLLGGDDEDEPLIEDLIIYGQIYSVKDELLTVNVPVNRDKRRIGVTLDENALVRIESDSLRNASVGDEIHAIGEAIDLPRFFATEVVVTHYSEDAAARRRTVEQRETRERNAVVDRPGRGGGDGAIDRAEDPFDIVRREREAREAGGGDRGDTSDDDGAIYFGRLIRIN